MGSKTILNVDGLDWKRDKWPWIAKKYIQLAEYFAAHLPNRYLTDSTVVQGYYQERFNSKPIFIPYGSEVENLPPGELMKKYQLEPEQYILFVGRLVPENNIHHLVQAFKEIDANMKCVIVGDAAYAEEYKEYLHKLADSDQRIIFTGYIFGEGYYELGANPYMFVETSGVGGTHPAVVEAMAFGNCVIVNNTPENLETIGNAGFSYDGGFGASSLREQLNILISDPAKVQKYGFKAQERANITYSWDSVTDQYEDLFNEMI
jgi:glycosyltransferase involved in cell wall biosynthesis